MAALNQQQKKAVEHNGGPLLLIAGAGTGKTTVITQKITHVIEHGQAQPENILALTFTDKAAAEMQERVDAMLDAGYAELQISTFHAFCQRLLEDYGVDIGLPRRFKLITQTDAWLLIKKYLYDFDLDYYRPLGNPTGQIHALLSHFSKLKDELVSPDTYSNFVEKVQLDNDEAEDVERSRLKELATAYHTYNQLLLENNCLDFGDLMYYTVKLLQARPNITSSLKKRFTHILVDEFQDVNWSQYQLIRLLTDDTSNLTVVGDDDQSIYSFRGSNVSIILRFKEDYPSAKEIVLTENYRSGQEILDLAYSSIQHNNPDRLEEKLHIDKKLHAKGHIQKAHVEHIHADTLDNEVELVVQKIRAIKENNDDVSWDDIAILARANAHVEPFLAALEHHRIPYEYLASSGLYRQPVVLDCVNFLQLLTHIYDDRALYRMLRMPVYAMRENDMQKITAHAKRKSISYYELMKRGSEFGISEDGQHIAEKIVASLHQGMKDMKTEKPTRVLYQFLEDSGYLKYLADGEQEGNRVIIRQIYHLKQFFDMIANFEAVTPDADVREFIEHYQQIIESGDSGKLFQPTDTPDSVNVITVHGSKGLEYRYVFVVNMVEERFPTRRKGGDIAIPDELIQESLPNTNDFHYEEERRLFYVAVTRAKEQLFLTSAEDYGGARKKKLSRFLAELEFNTAVTIEDDQKLKTKNPLAGRVGGKSKEMLEEKGHIVYESPTVFSHSQINQYARCPYQYKLQHILKLPHKGNHSLSFGNTIHNTLQEFYERVKQMNSASQGSLFDVTTKIQSPTDEIAVPSEKELLEIYEEKWIPDWYKNKRQREDYFKKGTDLLKVFYAAQEGNWTVPLVLEGSFRIKVGNYAVRGRIDRIDKLNDGSIEIIDYKTGKSKETLSTDDKQQLLLYQIAVQTLPQYRHEGDVSKLTFYYVNDDLRTSFVGKDKDIEKLQDKLLKTIEQIRSGDFGATPNPFVCQYCDFKEICEFRKL